MQRAFISLSTLSFIILSCISPVTAKAEAKKGLPASVALSEEISSEGVSFRTPAAHSARARLEDATERRLPHLRLPSYADAGSLLFLAQVTPDGTTSTSVTIEGDNTTIEQGDRVGDNLFHSFDEFSVPTGGSAGFNNAADIVNIFSRVTGSTISNIDGLVSANGAANLFLINPNGIIFGQNGRLNLGGSFFASTADSILFESDAEFSASNPQAAPILAISIPIGLNFRDNPGNIVNRSVVQNSTEETVGLEVASGNNLTFVGQNISFDGGNLTASGGNIELGSISQAGTVGINGNSSLSFPEEVAKADITLSNAADIDVRGTGKGNVTINARNLSLEAGESERSFIRAGILSNSTSGEAQAGDIALSVAEHITLNNSFITNRVELEGIGNSGDITVDTGSLEATNGGRVTASTLGQGNAGSVEIIATEDLTFDGENSQGFASGAVSQADVEAEGDAGGVNISTSNLTLTNGGRVDASTLGQGNAGSVDITATGDLTFDGEGSQVGPSIVTSGVNTGAEGDAGGVSISTNNLTLTNGGRVDANTLGRGNAGSVEIAATGDLTFDGESSRGLASGASSQVSREAEGDAGGVSISTNNLTLTNGGRVGADTLGKGNAGLVEIIATGDLTFNGEGSQVGPSIVTSGVNTGAEGDAGGVSISTNNLTLTDGGRVDANTLGKGNAGLVEITATRDLTFDGESSLGLTSGASSQVSREAEGDAGGVTISTNNLTLTNGGRVGADTLGKGNAGSVDITATGDLIFDGESSLGFASVAISGVEPEAEGDAGGVSISTNNLTLTNGGRVDATTLGQGNAGDVNINAKNSVLISKELSSSNSGILVNALINDGNGGNVNISTGQLTVENNGTIAASNFDSSGKFDSGTGEPGNIVVEADSINLDRGSIDAATQSPTGVGANITIASEDITLDNNALLSARAFEDANGGNLSINSGLILAFPNSNSDIVARAARGNGGRINIDTEVIIGLGERLSEPANFTNDIDASSEFGLQGDFFLNTPDFDPTSGLLELPETVRDASNQISQNPCEQGVGSEFLVTGKGGLLSNPNETLNSNRVKVGLAQPVPSQQQTTESNNTNLDSISEPVPAQGWVFSDGTVTLTAHSTTDTPARRSQQKQHTTCSSRINP